jgi:hypothetical protein
MNDAKRVEAALRDLVALEMARRPGLGPLSTEYQRQLEGLANARAGELAGIAQGLVKRALAPASTGQKI